MVVEQERQLHSTALRDFVGGDETRVALDQFQLAVADIPLELDSREALEADVAYEATPECRRLGIPRGHV